MVFQRICTFGCLPVPFSGVPDITGSQSSLSFAGTDFPRKVAASLAPSVANMNCTSNWSQPQDQVLTAATWNRLGTMLTPPNSDQMSPQRLCSNWRIPGNEAASSSPRLFGTIFAPGAEPFLQLGRCDRPNSRTPFLRERQNRLDATTLIP